MSESEWKEVRAILASRAVYAEAEATGFAGLTDEQRRALCKGLIVRGRLTHANRVKHQIATP